MNDEDLDTIFKKESKIGNVLKRQGFDLEGRIFKKGLVWVEKRRRGAKLRQELALKLSQPDPMTDINVRRLGRLVDLYGKETIRHSIFIDRFEVINLRVRMALKHRYNIRYVPAFISPYAPYGMIQGVDSRVSELELEKLLFSGGSSIKPSAEVATTLR